MFEYSLRILIVNRAWDGALVQKSVETKNTLYLLQYYLDLFMRKLLRGVAPLPEQWINIAAVCTCTGWKCIHIYFKIIMFRN